MKAVNKMISILLAAVLCLGLCPAAFAAEPVTPTPPDWIPAEHYLVFPGDEVYLPENWAKVLEMREEAANGGLCPEEDDGQWHTGEGSAGLRYETGLVRMKNAENAGLTTPEARRAFTVASWHINFATQAWYRQNGWKEDTLYYRLKQYNAQVHWLGWGGSISYRGVDTVTKALGIDPESYFAGPYMEQYPAEKKAETLADLAAYREREAKRLKIVLDGLELDMDTQPEVKNNRTMVPVRAVSEALGADVGWDDSTKTATFTRAGTVISMTIGSTTATVNGKPVEIDAPPYISGSRTLVPIRFISEFFGQNVEWDGDTRTASITENKSVAGGSNLEAWALPMGAMLTRQTIDADIKKFGLWARGETVYYPVSGVSGIAPPGGGDYEDRLPFDLCRMTLRDSWNINSREDLIFTVCSMTEHGHNDSFLKDVAYIKSLTPAQYNQYLKSDSMDSYMFPYTKQLGEKWGERGILCWDLFRMSNLVQWGYVAGYITYPEALALLEPAATLLRENFSSWEEAYENYLEGYNWWARNDILNEDIWETSRGRTYQDMRGCYIFDDSLFKTGVIPVPGLTAQQLLDEVLAD